MIYVIGLSPGHVGSLQMIYLIISCETDSVHLNRLQNKCTNCKGVKNNTNFGQITGIQEKLDITCE
jgi:hypothetical protein